MLAVIIVIFQIPMTSVLNPKVAECSTLSIHATGSPLRGTVSKVYQIVKSTIQEQSSVTLTVIGISENIEVSAASPGVEPAPLDGGM